MDNVCHRTGRSRFRRVDAALLLVLSLFMQQGPDAHAQVDPSILGRDVVVVATPTPIPIHLPPAARPCASGFSESCYEQYPSDASVEAFNDYLRQVGLASYVVAAGAKTENGKTEIAVRLGLSSFERLDYESRFQSRFGFSVWLKVLLGYSHVSGVPISSVSAIGPGVFHCSTFTAAFEEGRIRSGESGCTAMVHYVTSPLDPPAGLAAAQTSGLPASISPIVKAKSALMRFYENRAQLQLLEEDDHHIHLIVRGLKGEVLKGDSAWEKLTVVVTSWIDADPAKRTAHLMVVCEGFISAGMGDYPPDSAFTQSMEPARASALQEYIKALASLIISSLKNSG